MDDSTKEINQDATMTEVENSKKRSSTADQVDPMAAQAATDGKEPHNALLALPPPEVPPSPSSKH